jgi:hypothetical protein
MVREALALRVSGPIRTIEATERISNRHKIDSWLLNKSGHPVHNRAPTPVLQKDHHIPQIVERAGAHQEKSNHIALKATNSLNSSKTSK